MVPGSVRRALQLAVAFGGAQNQIVFVHPGPGAPAAGGWWAAGVGYTAQMQAAYAAWVAGGSTRWPDLRVVFALLGGGAPFQIERLVRRGLDSRAPFAPNMWFETSSYGARALELTLQTFGAGRLLFGSDAPTDPVEDALRMIATFGAALEVELLVSNPLAILNAGQAIIFTFGLTATMVMPDSRSVSTT